MSEIAKCPLCGKHPGWHDFDIEARIFDGKRSYFCCGMKAPTAVLWNRYAAAMELARATASFGNAFGADELRIDGEEGDEQVNALNNATLRVLEVFK